MNETMVCIGELQAHLNKLVEQAHVYTDAKQEIYKISRQLDELITQYYGNYKM